MTEERPKWIYIEKKPETDREYFENLTHCIFQAGLSWQLIAKKWPNFLEAFDGFEINLVAAYGVEDIKRLSGDSSIIRNKQKINATIYNAQEFQRIAEKHGSFRKWLDYIDKAHNYDLVIKKMKSRFKRVGPSTAHIFLWSVGESIKYDPSVHTRMPSKIV
ncbi:MAG: DNA-3-methyladenine glycosylase I [Candidatus Bathyarchaeota archaeon]|jgi:DNA-3-methyladenine glycosylase I